MPNYKSDNLTFLTIAEMTSMQVDSTDQDGLLFAVATDSTTFKMVMWRKTSSATIDNELVYPANGPGRWHTLPVGEVNTKEVLIVEGDTLPGTIDVGIDLIAQKKTNGDKVLKGRFDGVFEDFSTDNIAIYDDTLGSAVPPSGMRMAVVNKVSGDELYVAKNDQWELLDIAGGGDDTISFSQLPTGTTSNTVAIGNHSHTLDNLSDVVITAPSSGQIVSFNGTNWINQAPVAGATNLNGLTDVVISSPTNGQTLGFNGTNWINQTASSGGGDPVVYINHNSLFTNPLPTTPAVGKSIYIVNYHNVSEWQFYQRVTYVYASGSWRCISATMASAHYIEYAYGENESYRTITVFEVTGLPDIITLAQIDDMDGEYYQSYNGNTLPPVNRLSDGLELYFYNSALSQFHKFIPKITGESIFINAYDQGGSSQIFILEALPDHNGNIGWRRTF